MKKIIAILCLCAMLIPTMAFADTQFPDLPEGHWAYAAVDKMVTDGRVNGFPDGSFKPDELVTRWQFAKMAGGNPDLMSEPDRPATRDEAALYLWERAEKPEGIASGAVTKDSANPQAIAWAYSTGIMQGDDGLNLRLTSTLTRAEAACLIVRAEQELTANVAFKDTVDSFILANVWNSMQTGISYNPDANMINGELAYIALCISSGNNRPNYSALTAEPTFEGTYARALQLVCQECWGLENANAQFMAQPVTMQNAVAALSFYTMKQANGNLKLDSSMYEDASLNTPMGKMALQFAATNGIYLTAANKLDATRNATLKDIACVLLQLDEMVGLHRTYGTEGHSLLNKAVHPWPNNAADYAMILEEIPVEVYETPMHATLLPKNGYDFARNFAPMLVDFLNRISQTIPKSVKVKWTLYPSMVVENEVEAIVRVKLTITANPQNLTLNEILPQNQFTQTYTGNEFIVDISTGEAIVNVVIEADKYTALRAFAGKE